MKREMGTIYAIRVCDEDPDLSYLTQDYADCGEDAAEYRAQDAARLAVYDRGDWHMVGIYAEIDVAVCGTVQRLRSPGLWGIESDSDQSYFDEVAAEQVADLRCVCNAMGVAANDGWKWKEE